MMPQDQSPHPTSHPATERFGMHLMIDGYGADPARLADRGNLLALLDSVPDALGMHRICPAQLIEVGPQNSKDPGGLSGFVMIAESHFSFHTFPARGFVTIDLYTCQAGMDTDRVTALLAAGFGLTDMDVFVQPRGLRYPASDLVAD